MRNAKTAAARVHVKLCSGDGASARACSQPRCCSLTCGPTRRCLQLHRTRIRNARPRSLHKSSRLQGSKRRLNLPPVCGFLSTSRSSAESASGFDPARSSSLVAPSPAERARRGKSTTRLFRDSMLLSKYSMSCPIPARSCTRDRKLRSQISAAGREPSSMGGRR